MNRAVLVAGASLLLLTGCANSDPTDSDSSATSAAPQIQQTTSTEPTDTKPADNVHVKTIGEQAGWGCEKPGDPTAACAVTFTVTNIERFECEIPEIQTFQSDHYLIRVDLDVATTPQLAEDTSNQLATLFLNQWSAKTSDGYTKKNLDEKAGCISGVDQTDVLLPDMKTRPTTIIEIPNDSTELQLRPSGMQGGGGWSWSLEDVS